MKTQYTAGPLPAGWFLNGNYEYGYIHREDGSLLYILDDNGRIDREKIMTTLENYGHNDYAKRWCMDSIHAAAPLMYEALKNLLDTFNPYAHCITGDRGIDVIQAAVAAISAAEGN